MTLLVLNGVHAAGKTTIGEYLQSEGFRYEQEVAKRLIESDGYGWGSEGDESFQRAVFEREIKRDERLLATNDNYVVETWHVGNIAHAEEVASQRLVERERNYLRRALEETLQDVYGLFVRIDCEDVPVRSDDLEPPASSVVSFYRRIEECILSLYDEYGIEYTVVDNSRGELERTKSRALTVADHVLNGATKV